MTRKKHPARKRVPMEERLRRLGALAYLASMLHDQGDRKSARRVLSEMSACIEKDEGMARELYPELKLACQAFGYHLQTHEPVSMGEH